MLWGKWCGVVYVVCTFLCCGVVLCGVMWCGMWCYPLLWCGWVFRLEGSGLVVHMASRSGGDRCDKCIIPPRQAGRGSKAAGVVVAAPSGVALGSGQRAPGLFGSPRQALHDSPSPGSSLDCPEGVGDFLTPFFLLPPGSLHVKFTIERFQWRAPLMCNGYICYM